MSLVGKRIVLLVTLAYILNAWNAFSEDLRSAAIRADYVIIAPRSYFPIAERLARFRNTRNGFCTKVVDVDSVLAQFGAGVSPDTGLKAFIQYAVNNWSAPRPRYFVLAGNVNVIPSHPERETMRGLDASGIDSILMIDQWYVDVFNSNGTMWVDAELGRFPAWDSSSLSVMVGKTIAYETDTAGTWCGRAISISDSDYTNDTDFKRDAQTIQIYLDSLWADTVSIDIRFNSSSYLSSEDFIELWNEGAAVITYSGHASAVNLSSTHFFSTRDIDSLRNGNRLPICLFGGCDLTFDTGPQVSIPTHLLAHKGGGAVAVISSEGLSDEYTHVFLFVAIAQSLKANPGQCIGDAYENSMPEWSWQLYQRFTLLGDPALVIKRADAPASIAKSPSSCPESFDLLQNYPNPFNPSTVITYKLPFYAHVTLTLNDVLGRTVRTLVSEQQGAGTHSVMLDAGALPSGVYFYRLQAGSFVTVRKLTVLK